MFLSANCLQYLHTLCQNTVDHHDSGSKMMIVMLLIMFILSAIMMFIVCCNFLNVASFTLHYLLHFVLNIRRHVIDFACNSAWCAALLSVTDCVLSLE